MNKKNNLIDSYKYRLKSHIDNISNKNIIKIISLLKKTHNKKGKIYIIGNGGSASTASHIVNDLGIGLSKNNNMHFNIESLSDNSSVCTAISNDLGYENIFHEQIKNRLKKNDIIMAISCSGNSTNIIKAVKYANKMGNKVIGLTGFNGGKLKKLSNLNFHVETRIGEYGLVEDLHIIFNHIISSYFINKTKILV